MDFGIDAIVALGAEAVWVGTHGRQSRYKLQNCRARQPDIATTCIFGQEWPDAPMKVLRNRVVKQCTTRRRRHNLTLSSSFARTL